MLVCFKYKTFYEAQRLLVFTFLCTVLVFIHTFSLTIELFGILFSFENPIFSMFVCIKGGEVKCVLKKKQRRNDTKIMFVYFLVLPI